MKTSLIFLVNRAKQHAKSKKIPIYLRIIHNCQKAEARINAEVSEDEFYVWDPIMMRLPNKDSLINQQLNNIETQFRKFLILHETNLSEFTAKDIRDKVLGISKKKSDISLHDYLINYFMNSIYPNKSLTNGTKKNYKKAINHLNKYLAFKNKKCMLVKDLNNEFAYDFRDFLICDYPQLQKKAMTEVSASANIIKLRTIFSRAVDKELLAKNPFKSVKLKTRSPHRDRLNIVQIKNIYDLELSNWPNLSLYRDLFLFSIFTGLAFQDLMNLRKANLTFFDDGNVLITINRHKTDITTELYLVSYAIKILERFSEYPETEILNSVLPKRSNKELNLKIKMVGALAAVEAPIKLTTSGRGKLTTCFAGEDSYVQAC